MKLRGVSADLARDIVRWLDANHVRNDRPDLRPSYGSWLNQEVVWYGLNRAWMVRHKKTVGEQFVEFTVEDPEVMLEVALRWG